MGVRMIPTEAGPQMRFPTLNTKWLSRGQRAGLAGLAANYAVVRVHKNGTLPERVVQPETFGTLEQATNAAESRARAEISTKWAILDLREQKIHLVWEAEVILPFWTPNRRARS